MGYLAGAFPHLSQTVPPVGCSYTAEWLPYHKAPAFGSLFTDYLAGAQTLLGLYPAPPTLAGLAELAKTRPMPDAQVRADLVATISAQAEEVGFGDIAQASLEKLAQANAFTITTGHQLQVYLGPLYTILKAITAIKLARAAEAELGMRVVPIFWLASEDHDIDEISPVTVEGHTLHWQTGQTGATGRLSTQGLAGLLEGFHQHPALAGWEAYAQQGNLVQATTWLLYHLLGHEGLLVLDPAGQALKRHFAPMAKRELLNGFALPELDKASARLERAGYKEQIHGREINLFLLGEGRRDRIVATQTGYAAGDQAFAMAELLALADAEPERLSPNVVLRPIYQEMILPNLAYVGGPAEVAYWLQLGGVFAVAGVQMPVVWPRQSVLVLHNRLAKLKADLGLSLEEILGPAEALDEALLTRKGTPAPELGHAHAMLAGLFDMLDKRATGLDGSLAHHLVAERKRLEHRFQPVWRKFDRAWRRRNADLLERGHRLREALLPKGTLQERRESLITFLLHDPEFVQVLMEEVDPLQPELLLLSSQPA